MQTERRTADEQYRLIMECRSSGLSIPVPVEPPVRSLRATIPAA